MDKYTRGILDEALALTHASQDQLAAMLPADVYGDSPDSATVNAHTVGTMSSVIRQLVRIIEDQEARRG